MKSQFQPDFTKNFFTRKISCNFFAQKIKKFANAMNSSKLLKIKCRPWWSFNRSMVHLPLTWLSPGHHLQRLMRSLFSVPWYSPARPAGLLRLPHSWRPAHLWYNHLVFKDLFSKTYFSSRLDGRPRADSTVSLPRYCTKSTLLMMTFTFPEYKTECKLVSHGPLTFSN
jgi:hypothetical protein